MTDPLLPYAPVDPYLQNAPATSPPGAPMGTDHTALIALVTALLAGAALAQVGRLLVAAGEVAPEAASFLLSHPEVRGLLAQSGLASTERPLSLQRRQNAFRKASYLVHATRRLTVSWMLGTQPHYPGHPRTFPGSGLPWTGPGDGLTGRARMAVAWEREKAFLAQHLVAQSKRNGAALRVAQAWARRGRSGLLGWRAQMDSRTSGECRAANGRNFNPARIPPIGYPGSVHPNCLPAGTRISGFSPGIRAAMRRWYSGPMVEIRTHAGHVLTGTPNHPVLTGDGWVGLGQVQEMSYVFSSQNSQGVSTYGGPDEHHTETPIEQVFGALGMQLGMLSVSMPVTPEDFYGDGSYGEVDVIAPDSLLGGGRQIRQPAEQDCFRGVHNSPGLIGAGALLRLVGARASPGGAPLSREGTGQMLLGGLVPSDDLVGLLPAAQLDPETDQRVAHRPSSDSVLASEMQDALTGPVSLDQVVGVRRFPSWGSHVYDLTTTAGWYGANGIVVHNCRCVAVAPFATSLRVEDLYDGAENRTVAAATPGWAVRVLDT